MAWALLSLTCMNEKGTGDVMSLGDFGGLVPVLGAVAGAIAGTAYALTRRLRRPRGRYARGSGMAHTWRTRLGASVYGAIVVGAPTALMAMPSVGMMLLMGAFGGLLGGLTAFVLPGSADL